MEFNQERPIRANYIRRYVPNESFLIDKNLYSKNILLFQDNVTENWLEINNNILANNLTKDHFKCILELKSKPEILILGTGEKQIFPKHSALEDLIQNQIACEIMNTHAACRTFNILQQENRNVMAALML